MNYADPYISGIEVYVPLIYPGIKQGMYEISSCGNIRNTITGKLLSHAITYEAGGYHSVGLQMEDNNRKMFRVHRLVALAFILKTEEDILLGRDIVNHKDCNTDNNCDWNLEWVTHEENMRHGVYSHKELNKPVYTNQYKQEAKGRDSKWSHGEESKGENNGMSRVTEAQAIRICELLHESKLLIDAGKKGLSAPMIARGVFNGDDCYNNTYIVYAIKQRKRWTHVSKNYEF